MHTLMSEEDIPKSLSCIYCGCKVGKKEWKQFWEGHVQYLEAECLDCNKPIHFKMDIPKNTKDDEKDADSLEAKINVLEYWNKEK